VPLGEMSQDIERSDLAAGVDRQEFSGLHPENAHVPCQLSKRGAKAQALRAKLIQRKSSHELVRELVKEQAHIGHDTNRLPRAAIC
jgi:hypothetical protein